ncbi:molybdopterin molybdenumtransferase MoeA, partial [Micromonospora zamorensis]
MSTETAPTADRVVAPPPAGWEEARSRVYAVGLAAALPAVARPLADIDGSTLAEPLTTRTDLPAFPTSSVDGWAVRGTGPWRVVGRVLAGSTPAPLTEDGTTVEIATGAMVPEGASAVLRVEESTTVDGLVRGTPRETPEWRQPGEEAYADEELLPVGTPVDPAVIGLAASCGHDTLRVRRAPRAALLVFGDELLTAGPPAAGRVRDALGPAVP